MSETPPENSANPSSVVELFSRARLLFGATSLGNLFRVVEDSEKAAIVEACVRSGIQPVIIDSAGKYGAGLSLEVIGRELNRLGVSEDEVLISNKLAWRRQPLVGAEPTFEPGAWYGLEHDATQDISYEGILRCFEEGNELLGGRVAQLVSVHDPDEYLAASTSPTNRKERMQDILGAYRALQELKTQGRVVAVGVGAKNWQVISELSKHVQLDWAMFANSLTIMRHPPKLLRFMKELSDRGTAIVNSALFHGGFLLGGDFFDYRRVENSNEDLRRLEWRSQFHKICTEFDISPFNVGVAFGLSVPGVCAVALSSSRADRIASHVSAVKAFDQIPRDLWERMREMQLIDWIPD